MGCDDRPWNDPYPYENAESNTLFTAFSERPKHLDPARSYSEPEWVIIGQIYEAPLQFHYLKRPYELEPLTATEMPEVLYFDHSGKLLGEESDPHLVAYTDYIIRIKPGIYYEMSPAFAKNSENQYLYHHLTEQEANQYQKLSDFKERGTRELIAEDYIYQIKRLADPSLSSPIYGLMSRYILGLKELRETLNESKKEEGDLRDYDLAGVVLVDRYTYRMRIMGKYPQFKYWLAMPVPWEVSTFFSQAGLERHNISLDWYPVGTGPYTLSENNPDKRMTLEKNPLFRGEKYPEQGMPEDSANGLLADAGKPIPMINKLIFTLEKEDIPLWNKFLQGYYDSSGISSDNFTSTIRTTPSGGMELTEALKAKGVRLQTSISPGIWYWGFNMLDETVGGFTDKAQKLRQAISLAIDVQEFISIFLNDRGIVATGPIPPDIFGYELQPKVEENLSLENPTIENPVNVKVEKAIQLLKEAGYPNNFTLYFDAATTGSPDEIATHAWLKKQFAKIGINIIIRGTDYNRFQDKLAEGSVQIYFAGWSADYPDPENFLFLLYGPNSSAKFGGENWSNYQNPKYDKLFEQMRTMNDTPERKAVIQEMVDIVLKDAPWVWGFYPKSFALYHEWVRIGKTSGVAHNTLKYARINPALRAKDQRLWNQPMLWPLGAILGLIFILVLPAIIRKKRKLFDVEGKM